jgi:cyclophilin family peptidyl-prolyl cis-trans isomerase/HEAT repeat protein
MDRDWQIRRLAVAAAMTPATDPNLRARLITAGLSDTSPAVRYEALRAHGRHLAAGDCQPQVNAVQDPDSHVALLAIDLLATACPARADVSEQLRALVAPAQEPPGGQTWHRQAHAIVALARRAPEQARPLLAAVAGHVSWQARVYAARTAEVLGDGDTLTALAADSQSNVRAAAIDGLRQVRKHDADAIYRSAFARPDYPVVMAAARALEGTPDPGPATAVLIETLTALTAQGRDTSRDARLAILDRLAELGGGSQAAALAPYLADADPKIAARAAELLARWTGESQNVRTTRLRTLPLPEPDELDRLPAGLRVTMANGSSFDIRFYLDETPVAVWRIVRLARQGYYDNLTWHRIVPNFIVQGGSPGADEFVGDGPFMRDEFSMRSHVRGTVGVSTRGRDTGDAQLFINVADSPRLDHDYTIIGEVVAGLDVVDTMLEGDVMARVDLLGVGG